MIRRLSRLSVVGALVALPFFGTLSPAQAAPVATAPSITAEFLPDSIPSGEISTLTLTLEASASATENTMDLAFSATMPGDMEIASGGADTDCRGLLVADVGTNTIDFSGGGLPPSQSCTITVSVTTTATQTFTTSDLTSDQGTGGAAADTLTVLVSDTTITSSLSPAEVTPGNISRMTYSYVRPTGGFEIFNLTAALPAGVVVATPANGVSSCGGTINATAGGSSFSIFNAFSAVPANCSIGFDVLAVDRGSYEIETDFRGQHR